MKCITCGKENPENSMFCSACGAQLQNNTQPEMVAQSINNYSQQAPNNNTQMSTNNNSQKNITTIILVLVGLIVLAAIVFGSIYLIQQYKLKQVDKELQDQIGDLDTIDPIPGTNEDIKKYTVGESVTLVDDSVWYVMEHNGEDIILLSTQNYGDKTYFSNSENYYEKSIVKNIIENEFLPSLKSSVSSKGGNTEKLSARIISVDDIRKILNVSSSVEPTDIEINSSYKWLFETGSYWTNGHSGNFNSVYIVESWGTFGYISEDMAGSGLTSGGNKFYVRPVIETTTENIK